ncbi:hypothetical protein [Roseateles saccharophilus]|uniref:Type IV pilus assembly protein PilW n=1 Tax=Roseateles saccharophilus TaxID=304 RepID=A0A4R3UX60_ROSSA|nr:hypothetical protein [Roseateles saccharophilus]MDG0832689.1 hypothetical protein [Roseateles saccharophilus]TCU95377.1 type IV pilus assembly protein PilW [Roseateles saccharophilus]
MLSPYPAKPAWRRQRGLSMVELMIGLMAALFVVAGGLLVFVGSVGNSRRLLQEAQVNQQMRVGMDVVTRELRRAGYWQNAMAGTTTSPTGTTTTANPYKDVSYSNSQLTYSFAHDAPLGPCSSTATTSCTNNILQTDEQFGFKLDGGALKMQLGNGNWQPLTDTNIVTVSAFSVTPTVTSLDISSVCANACTTNCPAVSVRSYLVKMQGVSVKDSAVTRVLQESVRVRNDALSGACP